jgi:hypothetical protein
MPLFKQQVMVDELDFRRMKVNTTNWIHEARIKGDVGQMALRAHGIDLSKELVHVDDALLSDARLSVELSGTSRYYAKDQQVEGEYPEAQVEKHSFGASHARRYSQGKCLYG